jgi:hypothetical protein
LNLFELSLDLASDLDTLQSGSFTLATLTFDTMAQGTSILNINVNALGDANGDSLVVDVNTSSITVVPEPNAWFLFLSGLTSLFISNWRRKKSAA